MKGIRLSTTKTEALIIELFLYVLQFTKIARNKFSAAASTHWQV